MTAPSVSDIVNIGGTILSAGATAKSLFEGPPKMPKFEMPEPAKQVDMPTMDTEAVKRSRQAAMAKRQSSSGRQSTILQDEETLG
jgi:hypothetical protein